MSLFADPLDAAEDLTARQFRQWEQQQARRRRGTFIAAWQRPDGTVVCAVESSRASALCEIDDEVHDSPDGNYAVFEVVKSDCIEWQLCKSTDGHRPKEVETLLHGAQTWYDKHRTG